MHWLGDCGMRYGFGGIFMIIFRGLVTLSDLLFHKDHVRKCLLRQRKTGISRECTDKKICQGRDYKG